VVLLAREVHQRPSEPLDYARELAGFDPATQRRILRENARELTFGAGG
jgi:hypothetical protein